MSISRFRKATCGRSSPVGIELGRNHVAFGHGAFGGSTISQNARGLDMLRIAMDRPIRLPGALSGLGQWQGSGLLATMGSNRDIEWSRLTVLRLSHRSSRFTELGINYLNHQGGTGSPDANLYEIFHDTFLFWTDGGLLFTSDKVVGFDFVLTIPDIRSQWYVNFTTTDDRGRFQQPATGLWEDAIWLMGAKVRGLGPSGRFDVWGEWARRRPGSHTPPVHVGLTLDGRVIGDALGPNAATVRVESTGRAQISASESPERGSSTRRRLRLGNP